MPPASALASLSAELLAAAPERGGIEPPSRRLTGWDEASAYEVQRLVVERRVAAGERVAGYKVGLTTAAARAAMGGDAPIYGRLFAGTAHATPARIEGAGLFAPMVEPEIAFVLGRDLPGPEATAAEAAAAVGHVAPAFEVVDSRIAGWARCAPDLIADNGAGCGAVLGAPAAYDADAVRTATCQLRVDDGEPVRGSASAVLGDPLLAVVWLANALAGHGRLLRRGDVVLTGSMTAPAPLRPGTRVAADFGPLGTVALAVH
ncbi:2-keto-4-pentenoate hydratase [Rhizomonospora bruguierae]|uniref:2-keto-4-pentenoate hydratase n=1 Tax=Rhizomonospora bruguierae TaxID=1581705 RepID=UPI001BCEA7A9|nr:fumarylacetoacetate hydrolase family protein [Micromonospora sp. NBRC 107566]